MINSTSRLLVAVFLNASLVGCGSSNGRGRDAATDSFDRNTASCAELSNYCGDLGEDSIGSDRVCLYRAYAAMCQRGNGRIAELTTALRCVTAASSPNSCWTFSDPNSAEACVTSASSPLPPAIQGFWSAYQAKCTSLANQPLTATTEFFPYLSDATANSLMTCVAAAQTCGDANTCLRNDPVIAPFLVCGSTLPSS